MCGDWSTPCCLSTTWKRPTYRFQRQPGLARAGRGLPSPAQWSVRGRQATRGTTGRHRAFKGPARCDRPMRAQIVSRPQEDNQALALGNCFVCTATPLQAPCNLQPATWFRTSCFRARYPRSLVLFLSARPFHTSLSPTPSSVELQPTQTQPSTAGNSRSATREGI